MSSAATDTEPTRRDFLYVATAATGVVLTGSAVWPLIDQMNPDAAARAASTVKADIGALQEGAQQLVMWRGAPVFVRRRTAEEIDQSRGVDVASLPDADARNANVEDGAPATDENRSFGDNGEYVIMSGVCTHLGCVPNFAGGDYNGWYCPCHASHYDLAGRIRRGPAPENLPIPRVTFESPTEIVIG